jgi:ubiquinone biosynthesis accessory factor UbiK
MENSSAVSKACALRSAACALFWSRARGACVNSGHVFERKESLMEPFRIDEIARRLFESVPPAARAMQRDLEDNFRAVLRSSLAKLDLVTRDEFDAQVKVLERTRARLEALEVRLKELEAAYPAESSGN